MTAPLVSADEALERGEVPTVPHEGSPVLWASIQELLVDHWQTYLWLSEDGSRALSAEVIDDHASRELAVRLVTEDLRYCRENEGFGSPLRRSYVSLTGTASSTEGTPT